MNLRLRLANWLLKGSAYTVIESQGIDVFEGPDGQYTFQPAAPQMQPPPLWVQTLKGWALVQHMFDEDGQITADPRQALTATATLALTGEQVPINVPSCWMTMQ